MSTLFLPKQPIVFQGWAVSEDKFRPKCCFLSCPKCIHIRKFLNLHNSKYFGMIAQTLTEISLGICHIRTFTRCLFCLLCVDTWDAIKNVYLSVQTCCIMLWAEYNLSSMQQWISQFFSSGAVWNLTSGSDSALQKIYILCVQAKQHECRCSDYRQQWSKNMLSKSGICNHFSVHISFSFQPLKHSHV